MKCPICFEEKKQLVKVCKNHQYCELCVEISHFYFTPKRCLLCMEKISWIKTFMKNENKNNVS
jgi:hypothetical protein